MRTDRDGTDQIEETVQRLAEIHAEHHRSTTRIQRTANRVTSFLGHPSSVAIALLIVVAWILGNLVLRAVGYPPLEGFPFPDLSFVATVAAFLVALLILTTQRHQDKLAEKRSQLTLQIALLSERKIAKVIELLEEQRRDHPMLPSRVDPEADQMARSSDPAASLERLEALSPEQ